jgi:hypothetical protein
MKKTLTAGFIVSLLSLTGAVANTLTVSWAPNHSPQAGEFIVATSANGTFNSFCLEYNEGLSLGAPYYYLLSDSAKLGGVGGGNPDPISVGTAWLFKEFSSGSLLGYSSASQANQTALQNAFWMLEDEIAWAANPYLTTAQGALGLTFAQLKGNAMGAYGVMAVNLYADAQHTQNRQDVLYVPNVPDGGITLMLIGLGMGIMGFVARRARR